ncbi:MAG: hypothetical protein KJZ74_12375 [Gemmatimonadales bacterium]|nr:hypothetical protein [Gemmatimonadota bacterium]MCL4214698.1 hypothetical protein [Gemmatimonadales bacterium]
MSINPTGPSRPFVDGTGPSRPAQSVVRADEAPVRRTPTPPHGQRDVLDLSPAARALVAQAGEEDGLSAERLLEIRGRVLDGSYDAPAVLDAIAANILRSRDLG